MKRLFPGVLCALMLCTLAACGKAPAEATPAPTPLPTVSAPTPTPEPTPEPEPTPTLTPAPTLAPEATAALATEEPTLTYSPNERMEVGVSKPAAVADARAGINDISLLFVPVATEEGLSAFQDTATQPPRITTRYDEATGAFFLVLHDTRLVSGELQPGSEDWVYDYARDHELTYPYTTTMGSIGKDSRYFKNAAISSDGTDTTVSMLLTGVMGFEVEVTGLTENMFPMVRVIFS